MEAKSADSDAPGLPRRAYWGSPGEAEMHVGLGRGRIWAVSHLDVLVVFGPARHAPIIPYRYLTGASLQG